MCRIDGCDSPSVSRHENRRAAKSHHCDECSRTIEIGERYRYQFSVDHGDVATSRTCAHCQTGTAWLVVNCGGWIIGQAADELQEHAEEYPDLAPPLRHVVDAMQRQWQRVDGAGLMAVLAVPRGIQSLMEAA